LEAAEGREEREEKLVGLLKEVVRERDVGISNSR